MPRWLCDCNLGISSNSMNLNSATARADHLADSRVNQLELCTFGRQHRHWCLAQDRATGEGANHYYLPRYGTYRYVPTLSASSLTPRWNVMKSSRQTLILIWSYHQQLLCCFNQEPILQFWSDENTVALTKWVRIFRMSIRNGGRMKN